jgi:pilus assembly protein FimV
MHQNIRSTLIPFGLKALCAAVASALVCFSSANAAGLGKLTVLSSLGQPLRAEIELTSVAKDEGGSLVAKLASAEVFRQANIEFNPALMSLHFTIDQRSGRQYIRVTSSQPINEPFVDMLLELGSANGRLVREYTFLLDPVELRSAQTAQVTAPINVPAPSAAQVAPPSQAVSRPPEPVAQLPATKPVNRPDAIKPTGRSQSDYQVRKGDTLAGIANRVKPEGVSLDQMLVGLYRANPDAFNGSNMNRLRTGQILLVPTAEAAQNISKNEAKNIVLAQAADFNSYRNRLAGMVANATPNKSEEAKQSAGGKISAKVEERPTAASEAKDKLKLSKAANASATDKTLGAATSAEDKIAKDKAVADANARVKELEKNVTELQKILEIKSKDMAAAQQKQVTPPAAAKTAASTPAAATVPPVNLKPETKQQVAAVTPVPTSATTPTAISSPASTTATVVPGPVSATAVTTAKPAAKPVAKPAIKAKPVVPVRPEPSLLDDLIENSSLLAAAAALIAGLGGLGAYYSRRKKKNALATSRTADDASLMANSLFGSTGGQSVDTNNSVFNSQFAPSASQLDTNEVDPVAEADVYIAYGRDAQAEEILKEALRSQPERNAVRLKLLEIYAARKDIRLFDMQASELYATTKGEGEEWAHAATMGLAIDPNNPLYAGGELPDDAPAKAAPLHSLTQPLEDLDPEALLGNLSQQDALESTEIKLDDLGLENSIAAQLAAKPEAELDLGQVASEVTANGLDFDLSEPAAGTVTAFPDIAPTTAPRLDLDFDLGTPAASKAEAQAVAATKVAESSPSLNDLSFDLDMPVSGKAATEKANDLGDIGETLVAGIPVEAAEKAPEFGGLDFDLGDFGAAKVQAVEAEPVQVASENAGFDDFDFDLGDSALKSASGQAAAIESSIGVTAEPAVDFGDLTGFQPATINLDGMPSTTTGLDMEIELEGIDSSAQPATEMANIDLSDETSKAIETSLSEPAPVAFDVDLSSISLDLAPAGQLPEEPRKAEDAAIFDADIVIPSGNSEMATKLDLAAAYQEIGDKEGARELLDEVIAGGSADQIKAAREMRSKLA